MLEGTCSTLIAAVSLLLAFSYASPQEQDVDAALANLSVDTLVQHVRVMGSDAFEGRIRSSTSSPKTVTPPGAPSSHGFHSRRRSTADDYLTNSHCHPTLLHAFGRARSRRSVRREAQRIAAQQFHGLYGSAPVSCSSLRREDQSQGLSSVSDPMGILKLLTKRDGMNNKAGRQVAYPCNPLRS